MAAVGVKGLIVP